MLPSVSMRERTPQANQHLNATNDGKGKGLYRRTTNLTRFKKKTIAFQQGTSFCGQKDLGSKLGEGAWGVGVALLYIGLYLYETGEPEM